MKCVNCGENDGKHDNLCLGCYLHKNPIFASFPDRIKISKCEKCSKFFFTDLKMIDTGFNGLLFKIIKKKAKIKNKLFSFKGIEISFFDDITNFTDITVTVLGDIEEEEVELPYKMKIKVNNSVCSECSRVHKNYFEGILQIRWIKEDDELIKKIVKNAEKRNVQITRLKPLKNGYDFYMSNSEILQEIGQSIQKTYGGKIKVTATLFSKDNQTSKNIYRVTMLLRLPDFQKGDFLIVKRKIIRIESIKGSKAYGLDIVHNKKTVIDYNNEDYEIVDKSVVVPSRISKIYPNIEAIDPEDFQSKKLVNVVEDLKIDQKVKVAKINNKLFII